jgi:hypothetical protein
MDVDPPSPPHVMPSNPPTFHPPPSKKRLSTRKGLVVVEDIDDDEPTQRFAEPYPGKVAEALGMGKTAFEDLLAEQQASLQDPYSPFADEEEWGLARWMMKRVNQEGIDEYLKLPIVRFTSTWSVRR